MSSQSSHKIKKREHANDVFITPIELAKKHIEFVDAKPDDMWLDPCKNNGSYFNNIQSDKKDWCEILEEKDFFSYDKPVDIIIQNPPYSILNKWIEKNIELQPRVISMLIGLNNLTARRIEMLELAGYSLTKMRMLKVWKWYGMSVLVNFERDKEPIIEVDRKVYRTE